MVHLLLLPFLFREENHISFPTEKLVLERWIRVVVTESVTLPSRVFVVTGSQGKQNVCPDENITVRYERRTRRSWYAPGSSVHSYLYLRQDLFVMRWNRGGGYNHQSLGTLKLTKGLSLTMHICSHTVKSQHLSFSTRNTDTYLLVLGLFVDDKTCRSI